MDEPRLYVVQSMQRARLTPFEGHPVAPWTTGKSQSLPPLPDKPQKPKKAKAAAPAPAPVSPYPRLPRDAAIKRMLEEGRTSAYIASALGVDANYVYGLKSKLKRAGTLVVAAVTDVDSEQAEAVPAAVTPDASPVQPACLPASPERVRTHILDWGARMGSYEYSSPPAGCVPRKARKRVNGMTRGQMRDELRGYARACPCAINCAAAEHGPRPQQPESIKKPFETGQKGKFFAGGVSRDLDVAWRTVCIA
ncbi:hypothetical protein AWB69_05985 [Caballeronia udeis]|uniref:Uncharacterized protein n=1 Tax=Caballeronia udeis TaxID=1232866 RepID=A0A158IHV1_9BURK|nr:hypothetical protein AWB69_05985 [Caballeronia udeis]